jgi:hypothetical protein
MDFTESQASVGNYTALAGYPDQGVLMTMAFAQSNLSRPAKPEMSERMK